MGLHHTAVAPRDRGNFVLVSCFILGIGMLLPVNFYFNASAYWKAKWRNVHSNETEEAEESRQDAGTTSIAWRKKRGLQMV